MNLFLSRAVLKRDASFASLAPLLIPAEEGARTTAAHRLVWSLFADQSERKRDFLWHEEAPGTFLVLSERPPADAHAMFEIEKKAFAPDLKAGDRLAFFLRANPVLTTAKPDGKGRRRHDVVMAAIRPLPKGGRAGPRAKALGWSAAEDADTDPPAPVAWVKRQGRAAGFEVEGATALGYRQLRLPRDDGEGRHRDDIRFSTVDLEGTLTVTDPQIFLAAIRRGFGKAKAFGCGLMLIRRA